MTDWLAVALWCAPFVLTGWAWYRDRMTTRRLARVCGPRAETVARRPRYWRRAIGWTLLLSGGLAAAEAVARVRSVGAEARVEDGLDVVVGLDVSRSMLAEDVRPNRLERAKRAIQGMVARIPSARVGMVAFAGEAKILAPLTFDQRSVARLLARAEPSAVPVGGTSLGAAFGAVRDVLSLSEGDGRRRVVVLCTDGEDIAGSEAGVEWLRVRGVSLVVVAFGSRTGAKIPLEDGSYIVDTLGREAVTRVDLDRLRSLTAAVPGARLVEAVRLPDLGAWLAGAVAAGVGNVRASQPADFVWPLRLALVCWLLEWALSIGGGRRRSGVGLRNEGAVG